MSGKWRATYVVTAMIALWLNSFVLVVQAFQKVGFFKALAPTQSEPPFLIAQLVLLALVVVLGFLAVRRFRPAM
jgi:high-affinity Fe2+/Pb2+ permease